MNTRKNPSIYADSKQQTQENDQEIDDVLKREYIVFGFVRNIQKLLKNEDIIPTEIGSICLIYYGHKHHQRLILENDDLRARSINLITRNNNDFIKFLKQIFGSRGLNDKIWSKCDPNNTGKIETEIFMYFWSLPVTLFKVAVFQRKHRYKYKPPKLDEEELKKEYIHSATWIITKYGEKQSDGGCTFILKKDNYTHVLIEYVTKYADTFSHIATISSFKGTDCSPSPSDHSNDDTSSQNNDGIQIIKNIERECVVFGFIRNIQTISIIPTNIIIICLTYYGKKHPQRLILENDDLRERSINLLSVNNNGLIKFITKLVESNQFDIIWTRFDPDNTGKIKTKTISECLTLKVMFYKIHQHRQKNKSGTKPNIDNAEIKKSIQHLSVWIITTFGKKDYDNVYRIELTKQDFKTKLVSYLQVYIDNKGKHKL